MKKAAALLFTSAMLLTLPTPILTSSAYAQDIVIGGGYCKDKDVVIIIPNPANDDVIRICFNYPDH
jgi:hypothetical protein